MLAGTVFIIFISISPFLAPYKFLNKYKIYLSLMWNCGSIEEQLTKHIPIKSIKAQKTNKKYIFHFKLDKTVQRKITYLKYGKAIKSHISTHIF